jgi:hypothetical protein
MSKINPTEIAALPPANSSSVISMDPLLAMIERAARDPSIDMERLERLMQMHDREKMLAAEGAFNDAMAQAQFELTPIARDSYNPQTRSKYASYHAVDKAIRPIYGKYGFGISFDEDVSPLPDHVRVWALVTKGRFMRKFHYDSPIITTGMKGVVMMTLTHAKASAVTYAKRYLMGNIFNLSTGEDDDGNLAGMGPSISDDQFFELSTMMGEFGANNEAFCKLLKVESIDKLPARQFDSALALLKLKAPQTKVTK